MEDLDKQINEQNLFIEIAPRNLTFVLDNPGKKRECLLYPWLPRAGLALVYAGTGVGKTFFCLNAAYAMASGGDFLKFYAENPSRILYIDGEMSYDAMQPRIADVSKMYGRMIDPNNFNLLTCDQFINMIMPKISTAPGQAFYNRIIFENKIECIFLDNISTLSDVDENNANEWDVVQHWLIYLRAHGVSVVLVHHSGKDKSNQRGTSKREDILDSTILLEEIKTGERTMGTQFKISFKKKRNFFGEDAEPFEASLDTNGKWHMRSQEESTLDKVIELTKLGMSKTDIAYELGVNKSTVGRAYDKAVEQKLIIENKITISKPKKRGWGFDYS